MPPLLENTCSITVTNTSQQDAAIVVTDPLPERLAVDPESVIGATLEGNLLTFAGTLAGAVPPLRLAAEPPLYGYVPLSDFGFEPAPCPDDCDDGGFFVTGLDFVYQDIQYDAAIWSVRPEAIYREYRDRGLDVHGADDIFRLDLREVDRVIGYLAAKYRMLTAGEGVVTGAGGVLGIPADVVALTTLNLRAVGEYGTYCGFDVSLQQERLYAMHVLSLSSRVTDASKAMAMAELFKIGGQAAGKKSWEQLEGHAFVRVVHNIARALGKRLTKAKLAQLVPAVGAAVGGGFNAYYTGRVCTAAYHLYRERFLAEKYGLQVSEGG